MSEQITSLPAKARVALEGSATATLDAAGVGAALAGVLGAGVGAADGATLAGAWVGAVVAAPVHAETVMASTAIAAAAVRNERIDDLLQERGWVGLHARRRPGKASPPRRRGLQRSTPDWAVRQLDPVGGQACASMDPDGDR